MPCNLATRSRMALAPCIFNPLTVSSPIDMYNLGNGKGAQATQQHRPSVGELLERRRLNREAKLVEYSFLNQRKESGSSTVSNSIEIAKNSGYGIHLSSFRILVGDHVFTVDAARLSRLSPVFTVMCRFSSANSSKRDHVDYGREIVDEKWEDVADFFRCLHHNSPAKCVNQWNFAMMLRLADKYQVTVLRSACEEFIEANDLSPIKADQVLTLLIAANEHHLRHAALARLVSRLAQERDELTTYARLKLSRFLPHNLYRSVLLTNQNYRRACAYAEMCGHVFRLTENAQISTQRVPALCDACARIVGASDGVHTARCMECKRTLCRAHWSTTACSSDYGRQLATETNDNLLTLDYKEDHKDEHEEPK